MIIEQFLKRYDIQGTRDEKIPADVIIKLLKEYLQQNKYISVIDQHWLYAVELSKTGNRVVKSWNRVSNDYAATECNEFINEMNKKQS